MFARNRFRRLKATRRVGGWRGAAPSAGMEGWSGVGAHVIALSRVTRCAGGGQRWLQQRV